MKFQMKKQGEKDIGRNKNGRCNWTYDFE